MDFLVHDVNMVRNNVLNNRWFDVLLEWLVNACLSSPCRNGGQCISPTSNCSSTTCSASCLCPAGTSGIYCEEIDLCSNIICLNGGICSTNRVLNISYCQCPKNTIGERCETVQVACTSSTCSKHGVCFIDSSMGNFTTRCSCSEGFTGQYCDHFLPPSNPCSPDPCGFNGTCIRTSNSSHYCICPNGFTGNSCNTSKIRLLMLHWLIVWFQVHSVLVPVHLVDIYPNVNKSRIAILLVINVFVLII